MTEHFGKRKLTIRLYGSRTYLRPVVLSDAAVIRKWHNDPELMLHARAGEKKTTLQQEKNDIEAARASDRQAYHLIVTQPGDVPVGFLRFTYIDRFSGNVWLRMMIGNKQYHGTGHARDALRRYLSWLFYTLGIHRVTLECYSTNLRAIGFYKKLGFKKEGTQREAVLINGTYHDIVAFGLLKNDFRP